MRPRWICLGALLSLLACRSAPGALEGGPPRRVHLTDRASVALLPPSALGGSLEAHQLIEGSYGGQTYYLEAYVRADRERLLMLAFNSFGARLFEIEQTERTVRFSPGLLPEGVKPEYILADFQLCFFPAAALRRSLGPAGLRLEERREDGELLRTVRSGAGVIIQIRRGAGELRYRNLLRGYQYVVRED
jgi:hypothetical protein